MAEGFAQARFAGARTEFDGNLERGEDVGATFCATLQGETVVDLWGGRADQGDTRRWERDTIVNVYSTTKTLTALTALLLADRGELDFSAPVARYWPEFAANGKTEVKVSHLMSHAAGLSGWKEPVRPEDLYDWEKATSLLAAQAPYWEPGTACGYHAMTQGFLIGEVVRRITGRTVGSVFRTEIAEPLGADFWIGLPASEDRRVAELIPPESEGITNGEETWLQANMSKNPGLRVAITRSRAWRGAELPAANGHGHARAVAECLAILANGGWAGGRRFMSEAGCRKALELQIEGTDLILGRPARYGMGFGLPGPMAPLPNANSIFWGGYGGSLAVVDMDARATMAYVMNKMAGTTTGDLRAFGLAMQIWGALG
jgi:CubicO group peptidase (beta-lactamase class C family)